MTRILQHLAIPGILLFLLMFGLSSCRNNQQHEESPAMNVRIEKVKLSDVPGQFAYPGTIEGHKKITLSTKVMGQVVSLPFDEGATVSRGQIVATIRSGDLEAKRSQILATRDEAAASLKNIETQYNRIKELYTLKSATQKEFDDVTMAYDMAGAKMKTVDEMEKEISDVLGYAKLVAPISGSIVGKFLEEGDMANPGMPVIAIEDATLLDVSTLVPESEIEYFHKGDSVTVRVDALGEGAFIGGTVDQMNLSGDAATRQFHVKVRLNKAGSRMVKSGMYATVILSSSMERTIAVPESLIVQRGQLDGLYIVSPENEALLRWVRTGKKFGGGQIEILSGLAEGESIVTAYEGDLRDGMKVGVIP